MNLSTLPRDLTALSDEDLLRYTNESLQFARMDRQEWQLTYYQPVSPSALQVHLSTAHLVGVFGGNRSGKTETNLVEAAILMTGIIPDALQDIYPREKLRGPVSVRIVCESITTTLAPVILHKLRYTDWNGTGMPGGTQGHWGWIPKSCLINEDWEASWKEAKRTLTVLCRDTENPDRILGHSTLQVMSKDQDPAKFASGEFHLIVMDEPPTYAIFRENRARVMSVGGRLLVGMTWPDDPTIPVDFIFDEIYEPGQPGPTKDEDIDCIQLVTTENTNIDQVSVAKSAAKMSEEERACRIGGKPIRFSNLIHPLFTDTDAWWCFTCHGEVLVVEESCTICHGQEVVLYNHVQDFPIDSQWPVIFLLDPHPRKPHMGMWVSVDGNDDYSVLGCLEVNDEPSVLKQHCDAFEREHNLSVVKRLGDRKMLNSYASSKREVNWQDEFAAAGLHLDFADQSDVGRVRLNEYLKPDPHTHRPRIRFRVDPFERDAADAMVFDCKRAVFQMKRFCWSDFKHADEKSQKQLANNKYDDYPALGRYLMNELPRCTMLRDGGAIVKPRGRMANGY